MKKILFRKIANFSNKKRNLVYLGVIIILCLITFQGVVNNDFYYDDYNVLKTVNTSFSLSNLRYISWLTLFVNSIHGETNTAQYHAVNFFIHICVVVVVYFIVLLLVNRRSYIPFFVAALFALHPLVSEPVNYISARFTQLATLFAFLSLLLFMIYNRTGKKKFMVLMAVTFLLGMFSKEVGVFYASAGLFLYTMYFTDWRKSFRKKYFLVIPAGLIISILLILKNTEVLARLNDPSFYRYFLIQNKVFIYKYLRLMLLPVNQSIDHFVKVPVNAFFDIGILLSLGFNIALLTYAIVNRNRRKLLSFAIAWMFLFHFPYFFLTSAELTVEYRAYPMLVGFLILLGGAIEKYINYTKHQRVYFSCILILFSVMSINRTDVWENGLLLWSNALEGKDSGRVLVNRGNSLGRNGDYNMALDDLLEAKEKNPGNAYVYEGLAKVMIEQEDYEGAIKNASRAIELDPDWSRSYLVRGNAYNAMEDYYKAIRDYRKTLELDPNNRDTYYNLGNSYKKLGLHTDALDAYTKYIALDAGNANAYNNRGVIYKKLRRYNEALADYNRAIKLDKANAEVFNNRAMIYVMRGLYTMALSDLDAAIVNKPLYAKAYCNRGSVYGMQKDFPRAIEAFNKAIEIKPGYAEALKNRDLAYEQMK